MKREVRKANNMIMKWRQIVMELMYIPIKVKRKQIKIKIKR